MARIARKLRWLARLRALATTALIAVVLLVGAATLGGWLGWRWVERELLAELPQDLTAFRAYRPQTTVTILDSLDTPVDEFFLERRVWVDLATLPEHVGQAFIAAEDRRFWDHPGVDLLGVARAILVNLESGEVRQGGSTLTQQLVKNLLVGGERSYRRKIVEAVLAWRLEQELDKEQILELYLNYVYLGSGNYGVEAAAQDYFGLPAAEISAGQAAALAGLIPAPSRYSPRVDPELAAARRDLVLALMVDEGYLTPEQADAFRDEPPSIRPRKGAGREVGVAYVTAVRREIRRLMPGHTPFEAGLTVRTPLLLSVLAAAVAAIREAVEQVGARQGRQPPGRGDLDTFRAEAPGLPRDPDTGAPVRPDPGACFDAVVDRGRDLSRLVNGPFLFALHRPDREAKIRDPSGEASGRPLRQIARGGDRLAVCLRDDGAVQLAPEAPWANGAAVALAHETGQVVALVGGYEVGLEGFIRATQARRQPGSSFKAYIYAAALAGGRSQLDIVQDTPLSLPAGGGKVWAPKNYGGTFSGPQTLRTALARSTNIPAIRLALDVGVPEVTTLARAMGVRTPLRTDPTVALGSSEVTPMDQAIGYATIARLGRSMEPVWIRTIEDVHGHISGEAGSDVRIGGIPVATLPGPEGEQVLDPGVAYELADMLHEVVRGGTARRAHVSGLSRYGKTGTTNNFVDAWFVGFTPRHTVAVWIGTDGTTSLGPGETGGRAALPAWIRIVQALGEEPGLELPMPDEAVLVRHEGRFIPIARGHVPRSVLPKAPSDAPLPAFGASAGPP